MRWCVLWMVVALATACGDDDCSGPDRVVHVTATDLGGSCPPSFVAPWMDSLDGDGLARPTGDACGPTSARDIFVSSDGLCTFEIYGDRVVSRSSVVDTLELVIDPSIAANAECSMICSHRVRVTYE